MSNLDLTAAYAAAADQLERDLTVWSFEHCANEDFAHAMLAAALPHILTTVANLLTEDTTKMRKEMRSGAVGIEYVNGYEAAAERVEQEVGDRG